MLIKLLKYEFRAMGRVLLPIFGATLIMSIITGISYSDFGYIDYDLMFENAFQTAIGVTFIVSRIAFVVLIAGTIITCVTFAISRFKKNILGNEGYLMNTLPATPLQHISSKLITATAFQILASIVSYLAVCIIASIVFSDLDVPLDGSFFEGLLDLFMTVPDDTDLLVIFTSLVSKLAALIAFNAQIYAAMAIGHSFNSGKNIKSIGFFLLFSIVATFAATLFSIPSYIATEVYAVDDYTYYLIYTLASAVKSAALFGLYLCLSSWFLKNKLNLE